MSGVAGRESPLIAGKYARIEAAPDGGGTPIRGLTRSSGTSREGLAMKATRHISTRRHVNDHAHPEFVEAVTVSRFWRMVATGSTDSCWPWLGDQDGHGYGIFTYHGTRKPAHEMALSFSVGEKRIDGFDTCHSCDNPICCNPHHLRFGTRQSNVDDMFARGRNVAPELRSNAKLTPAAVREIRLRRAMGALQKDLATDYGVNPSYVSEIVNGLVWQDAGGPITGNAKRTKKSPTSRRGKVA